MSGRDASDAIEGVETTGDDSKDVYASFDALGGRYEGRATSARGD